MFQKRKITNKSNLRLCKYKYSIILVICYFPFNDYIGWSARRIRLAASTFVDTHFTTDCRQQFSLTLTVVGIISFDDSTNHPNIEASKPCDMLLHTYTNSKQKKGFQCCYYLFRFPPLGKCRVRVRFRMCVLVSERITMLHLRIYVLCRNFPDDIFENIPCFFSSLESRNAMVT